MRLPSSGTTIGRLRPELPSTGTVARRTRALPDAAGEARFLDEEAARFAAGKEQAFPHRPRAGRRRLRLALDRGLSRHRAGAGAGTFELLARVLASEKAAPGLVRALGGRADPVFLVVLDRSRHLVSVSPDGSLIGLNRAALDARGLCAPACLVAVAIAHGLRAAARIRRGDSYEPEKETARDVQNLLTLLVGILGTEWEPEEIRNDFLSLLEPGDELLTPFLAYARKLRATLVRRQTARLDDRVFRDAALFDRLPAREKRRVIAAGTLAWYGMLTLGLLRLPRRAFARMNPYYETAWWIFRAKPGGRRVFKTSLLRRSGRLFRSFRFFRAFEALWSAWNPVLAETCLRPVYRLAGGNRRPFLATIATYAYTTFVIHPLWLTLGITGAAWGVGAFWPWIHEHTRLASRENLILHGIVIGIWMGIGLIIAIAKLRRSRPTAS